MFSLDGLIHWLFLCVAAASVEDVRVANEAVLGAHVSDLQWLGEDRNIVLLQTHLGHLLRSSDGGETWVNIANQMNRTGKVLPGTSPHAPIRRIVRSPVDPNTVFAHGAGEDSFVSTDGGLTWQRIELEIPIQGFAFHSRRSTWALFSYWSRSCMEIRKKDPCSHNLYVTKDLGKTFSLVCSHIVQFNWGKTQFSQSDRVYFTHFRDKSGSQHRLTRWMHGIDFAYTDDLGKTVARSVPDGNKFQMSYDYILVVKVTNPARQNVSLMISSDGAQHFAAAKLPHRIWQHSFALLDASEGALVLHVNQGRDIGDIYISDSTGGRFTMSLSKNVRSGGLCAFEKVMNLNGVFISNIYEKYSVEHAASKQEEEEAVEASSTDTQAEMRAFRNRRLALDAQGPAWEEGPDGSEGLAELSQTEQLRLERTGRSGGIARRGGARRLSVRHGSHIRTVISFDAGGAWSYVKAPKKDSKGNDIQCEPERCWLHLHDFTEIPMFSPVYSYKNAVGIIMASGNVGPYLSTRLKDANTYLSRDGGFTWTEVHKGTFIYEFGNHGGLIVMADMVRPTQTALFSWDEGNSWHSFKIAEQPMKVDNVIIEPEAMSTKFLLYGDRHRVGISKFIDFGNVHKRTCQGVTDAGTSTSDYEKWVVPCILGHQGVYVRRKQLSQCFNAEPTERHRSRRVCKCQMSSYECSVGFARKVGSLECFVDNPRVLAKAATALCIGQGQVPVRAYRKVPGDVCEGGWKPEPFMLPCPPGVHVKQSGAVEPGREGSSLPMKSFLVIGTVVAGMCLVRSEKFMGWAKGLVGWSDGEPPRGSARDYAASQIGHSSMASAEMVGLAGSMEDHQGSYRPPEI